MHVPPCSYFPASHGSHTSELLAPSALDEVPAGHSLHASSPVSFANVPIAHSMQLESRVAPSAADAFPNGHGEQNVDLAEAAYDPALHGAQSSMLAAVLELLKVPAGQSKQRVSSRYWPSAHAEQLAAVIDPASAVCPTGQSKHISDPLTLAYFCRGQAIHDVEESAPCSRLYLPFGQRVQFAILEAARSEDQEPRGHFSQPMLDSSLPGTA